MALNDEQKRIVASIRPALADSDELTRSYMLRALTGAVYDAVKFDTFPGRGLDGRDGDERNRIGKIKNAVEDYHQIALQHALDARRAAAGDQ